MTLEEIFTFENLNNAFYESAKISHWKDSTQRYKANLLCNNIELQNDLLSGKYIVSPTTNFLLNERGKIRDIKAPAQRDRIVQKVLCQKILIPYLTKPLIYDNYASLKNRGTTFARKRIDILLRKYIQKYGSDGFVLQVDIKKYFGSIDHAILKNMLHKGINEPKEVMDLIDYIVDSSSETNIGLNLGSEAPQIFAIYYLHRLDNYIKTVKSIKYYGRYMDDMIIFSNNKEELKELLNGIKSQLSQLNLEINDKKTHITKLSHGFTFMQIKYHIKNGKIIKRPTHAKVVRERRRLKKYKKLYDEHKMSEFDIHNCYLSWRNSVIKDCNSCKRTIESLDNLYNELFPEHETYYKFTRTELINKTLEDSYEFYNIIRRHYDYQI